MATPKLPTHAGGANQHAHAGPYLPPGSTSELPALSWPPNMKITTGSSHSSAKLSAAFGQDHISGRDVTSGPDTQWYRLVRASETLWVWAQDAMEATLAEHEPAVRRLCIATAVGTQGLLADIQRSEGFCRLYLMSDPTVGVELAFASPGLDEMGLVTDLIVAMRRKAMLGTGLRRPVLAGFHVGITKVIGDGLGGAGADRTRALIQDPAIKTAPERAGSPAPLAVAVTSGLFEDLRAEGLPDHGWQSIPAAGAWLKLFDSVRTGLRPSPTSHVWRLGLADKGSGRRRTVARCAPLWTACGGRWPLGAESSDRSLS